MAWIRYNNRTLRGGRKEKIQKEYNILFLLAFDFPCLLELPGEAGRLVTRIQGPKIALNKGLSAAQNHKRGEPPEREHGEKVCGELRVLVVLLPNWLVRALLERKEEEQENHNGEAEFDTEQEEEGAGGGVGKNVRAHLEDPPGNKSQPKDGENGRWPSDPVLLKIYQETRRHGGHRGEHHTEYRVAVESGGCGLHRELNKKAQKSDSRQDLRQCGISY